MGLGTPKAVPVEIKGAPGLGPVPLTAAGLLGGGSAGSMTTISDSQDEDPVGDGGCLGDLPLSCFLCFLRLPKECEVGDLELALERRRLHRSS